MVKSVEDERRRAGAPRCAVVRSTQLVLRFVCEWRNCLNGHTLCSFESLGVQVSYIVVSLKRYNSSQGNTLKLQTASLIPVEDLMNPAYLNKSGGDISMQHGV